MISNQTDNINFADILKKVEELKAFAFKDFNMKEIFQICKTESYLYNEFNNELHNLKWQMKNCLSIFSFARDEYERNRQKNNSLPANKSKETEKKDHASVDDNIATNTSNFVSTNKLMALPSEIEH